MENLGIMSSGRLTQSLHDFQKFKVKSLSDGGVGAVTLLLSFSRMSLLKNFISSVSVYSPVLFKTCNDFFRDLIEAELYFPSNCTLDLAFNVPYSREKYP